MQVKIITTVIRRFFDSLGSHEKNLESYNNFVVNDTQNHFFNCVLVNNAQLKDNYQLDFTRPGRNPLWAYSRRT